MSNYIIRKFQISDRDRIEKISWQIQEWEKKFYSDRALSKEIINKHVDRLVKPIRNGQGVILIAEINKKCIGYVAGSIQDDFLNVAPVFYINDLGVDENYRGKGIGTALLQKIEKLAKEEYKLTKIMIGVISGNDGVENLYKRLGYTPYELELVKTL